MTNINKFQSIEGESGLFEIKRVKLLYEVIPLECGYLKKNLDTNKFEIIKLEEVE